MLRHALVVVTCWGLAGCGNSDVGMGPVFDLDRAEARWERAGIESYVFAVQRMCFCGYESTGPVRVRVEDGAVVERVYVDTGDPVSSPYADFYPDVEGLFAILRSAYDGDAYEVHVTYDPELGVPTDFWINYIEFAVDEELGMQVTEPVEAASAP